MVIFTKKFGTLDPHLPIVWDKVPKKRGFFDTFPYFIYHHLTKTHCTLECILKIREQKNDIVYIQDKACKTVKNCSNFCRQCCFLNLSVLSTIVKPQHHITMLSGSHRLLRPLLGSLCHSCIAHLYQALMGHNRATPVLSQ